MHPVFRAGVRDDMRFTSTNIYQVYCRGRQCTDKGQKHLSELPYKLSVHIDDSGPALGKHICLMQDFLWFQGQNLGCVACFRQISLLAFDGFFGNVVQQPGG